MKVFNADPLICCYGAVCVIQCDRSLSCRDELNLLKLLVSTEPKPFIDVSVITRFNQHSNITQFK